MAKRKPLGRSAVDVDDVLAGREKPNALELLDLIHRENPTGRAIGAREAEVRYVRKARLQSLLVRRFSDELDVVADGEGTVSIRHRGHGRDGCHAVIDALDEDARAWVRRELDLGAPDEDRPSAAALPSRPKSKAAAPTEDDSPDALIRRAAAAIEAYDYELGRELLERALPASGGAPDAARALLALLVDTLGDDASALATEKMLSRAALADPEVRGLLALAAARAGEEDRATALARGAREDRAGAAFAALAAGALARADEARAGAHLDRAKKLDPTNPSLAGVEAEIGRVRAAARGPAEAEIAALMAAGRDAEVQRAAEAVLRRWPESEAARRTLRTLEERRRAMAAEQLATEAEAALQAGAVSTAVQLLRAAAAAAGKGREDLERRAAEIEARDQARREAERVDEVCAQLESEAPRAGLLAYLALGDAARARVRDRCRRQELATLEQSGGGRADDRSRVEAALALARAKALADADLGAARMLLAAHDVALDRVPEARRLVREVEARLSLARADHARREIMAARADLARGEPPSALARLDAASLRDLPQAERAEAEALRAEAARVADRRRRAGEVADLRAAGRLFEARALAEQLGGTAEGEERSRWEGERSAIQAAIQRAFRVEVDDAPQPAEELSRFRPLAERSKAPCWLTGDGRAVVIVRSHDRAVVVRVLDIATCTVRPTILLRVPEPLGSVDVTVCGDTLWIVGHRGAIMEISMRGWEVRDFRPSSDVAAPTDVVENAALAFGEGAAPPRHFWVASRPRGTDMLPDRLRVIDLAQRRPVREVREGWRAESIPGMSEPRVAVHAHDSSALFTPRGAAVPHGRLDLRLSVQGLAPDAEGRGLVATLVAASPEDFLDGEERPLQVGLISPEGALGGISDLDGTNGDLISALAATRGSGLVFVSAEGKDTPELFAFAARDGKLHPLWKTAIAEETTLVQDLGARRVVALVVHESGVDMAELGPSQPTLTFRFGRPRVRLPNPFDIHTCGQPKGQLAAEALAQARGLRTMWGQDAIDWARVQEAREDATPEKLIEIALALRFVGTRITSTEANEMVARLFQRFPDHPQMRVLQANRLALSGQWAEAGAVIEGVDEQDLDEAQAQHVHHLRALLALRERRFEDVAEEVEQGFSFDGECDLEPFADLTGGFRGPPVGGDKSSLGRVVEAIHAADDCFARGDDRGAILALDRPEVWAAGEVQSLARLVEAYLRTPAGAGVDRVRRVVALGTFLDVLEPLRSPERREAVLPETWDERRVLEVAERARAWLEEIVPPAQVS